MAAIEYWEGFLFQSWHAHSSLAMQAGVNPQGEKGSVIHRLDRLYNHSKHTEELVKAQEYSKGTPLCVWLCNNGLESAKATLSFDEMANDILDYLAKFADAVQDPISTLDTIRDMAN
jgi:hypothetical protein